MTVMIILVVLVILLFAGAFFSRRRFGLLGLGLTAGAILSPLWSDTASLLIAATGIVPGGPLSDGLAKALIILVPAILLLFHGYAYKSIIGRIAGSLLFTVLALAFLGEAIGSTLVLTGPIVQIHAWLVANRDIIISIGVVLAVADVLVSRPTHKSEKKHHR